MPISTKKKVEKDEKTMAPIGVEPALQAIEEPEIPKPSVTAIVFSYDNAPGLRRCLTALENSNDRQRIEILVVDCGSHDESPSIDSEFENITVLRLPRYFGRTKALNIGTRTAAADVLFFLTTEVEVMPTTIPALLRALEEDPDIVAVSPMLLDTQGRPTEQFFRLPDPASGQTILPVQVDTSNGNPTTVEYANFKALMVRKYFVRGINYLDERYGDFGGDAELAWQIRRAAKRTVVLPTVTALYTPTRSQYSSAAQTVVEADRLHGLATFFGKHYGFIAALGFRLKAILGALFGFRFPLLFALLSDSKIDGSQSAIL